MNTHFPFYLPARVITLSITEITDISVVTLDRMVLQSGVVVAVATRVGLAGTYSTSFCCR